MIRSFSKEQRPTYQTVAVGRNLIGRRLRMKAAAFHMKAYGRIARPAVEKQHGPFIVVTSTEDKGQSRWK